MANTDTGPRWRGNRMNDNEAGNGGVRTHQFRQRCRGRGPEDAAGAAVDSRQPGRRNTIDGGSPGYRFGFTLEGAQLAGRVRPLLGFLQHPGVPAATAWISSGVDRQY